EHVYEDLKESPNYLLNPRLREHDQAYRCSCLDHLHEVLGDAVPGDIRIEAILKNEFDNLKEKSEGALSVGKTSRGKSVESQSSQTESEIVPKVAKMTVSGKKRTMGFEVPGLTCKENGESLHTPDKAPRASEELSSTPTPVKKSGKRRHQIDVKAKLEKQRGGKQLLNLVIMLTLGKAIRTSFIPNMITGASQTDVAVLVVDASRAEFEAGFESGGQMWEHGLLVPSLGMIQFAVTVSKRGQIGDFKPPQRSIGKPFRLSDVFKVRRSGLCVTGKIEAGYVHSGDQLLAMSPNEPCIAKGITLMNLLIGQQQAITLVLLWLGWISPKSMLAAYFVAPKTPSKLVLASEPGSSSSILKVFCAVTLSNLSGPAVIQQLINVLSKSSGEVAKKKPKMLTKGLKALVELQT
ncbi:hypothetical protein U0070_004682, partial [Myodes glareolus]